MTYTSMEATAPSRGKDGRQNPPLSLLRVYLEMDVLQLWRGSPYNLQKHLGY